MIIGYARRLQRRTLNNMQIGLRLHDSKNIEIRERLDGVKQQGFSCVHLALSKIDGLVSGVDALSPGYAMYLRHLFDEAGLDIAVLGNYLNLAHPDKDTLKTIQHKYIAHLRFASHLCCSVVGTETGAPNPTYSFDKESCHSDWALDLFVENLKPVVEAAEKFGVILAIEPVYKHIVYSPERARIVLDKIGSPNLQIIFDPVNLLHPDNLHRRDEIIKEAIELLGPDISIIHLKDYVLNDGNMDCLGCGFGQMDYERIVRFAVEKKPYIQATLENTTPDNAIKAREYIQSIERKILEA